MLAAHDADGGAAATGPKLIYEDGALQHAGMYWEPELPRGAGGRATSSRACRARSPRRTKLARSRRCTGACLLVGRPEFEAVGGFDPAYILGDFEDSDLCIRLQESGRPCRYEPAAELVHLERQSLGARSDAVAGDGAPGLQPVAVHAPLGRSGRSLMADS